MRHKNILWLFMTAVLLLSSCFEDKGNYDYLKIDPPQWLIDINNNHIKATGRSGGMIQFKASDKFFWNDENRANDVRYEWRYNDVIISTELDFEIGVDEFMKKANIKKFTGSSGGVFGKFTIIEKSSEITHMCKVYTTLFDRHAAYDWIVLSEKGNDTKCSMILEKERIVDNNVEYYFDLDDNSYEIVNGEPIPGKPINLHMAKALNIGALGSATIMTTEVCYEVDLASLKLARNVKDDFPDGLPADFTIVDRDDIDADWEKGANTFIANSKGEIYTRQLSTNYLGGSFISEPYIVDSKGSKITKFGHHLFGSPNIPCWDEKNNRVLMANRWPQNVPGSSGEPFDFTVVYKCRILPVKPRNNTSQKGIPVWGMPDGTKMLHLSQFSHGGYYVSGTNVGYTMIYNTSEGKTMIGDFVIDGSSLNVSASDPAAKFHIEFPGGNLDENTIFLTSAIQKSSAQKNAPFRTFYTQGNKVMYMERPISTSYIQTPLIIGTMFTYNSNVSFLTYDWYDCQTLIVGCENGDILFYNVRQMNNPTLKYHFNVGGKVIAVKQLGSQGSNTDYF